VIRVSLRRQYPGVWIYDNFCSTYQDLPVLEVSKFSDKSFFRNPEREDGTLNHRLEEEDSYGRIPRFIFLSLIRQDINLIRRIGQEIRRRKYLECLYIEGQGSNLSTAISQGGLGKEEGAEDIAYTRTNQ
jgi:hypothetical protein